MLSRLFGGKRAGNLWRLPNAQGLLVSGQVRGIVIWTGANNGTFVLRESFFDTEPGRVGCG
jgi:hypothetical protein